MALMTNALTSEQTIIELLQLSADETSQWYQHITRWVNAATQLLEHIADRKLASRVYTNEAHDGTGKKTLLLKEYPVTALTALSVLTSDLATTYTIDVSTSVNEVRLVADTGELVLLADAPVSSFLRGHQNVLASFTAGFIDDTDRDMLEEAVIELVTTRWHSMTRDPLQTSKSDTIGNSVQFSYADFRRLPFWTQQAVTQLRRRGV